MMTRDEALARVTGPGQPFEIAEELVLGEPMDVFARRHGSLRELLEDSARFGDAEYLVSRRRRLSFSDHLTEVAAVAQALREEYGVRQGDRVAICAANSPEWIVAFWATVSIGAVAVGVNSLWAAPEIADGLDLVEPTVVIADAARARLIGARGPGGSPVLVIQDGWDELVARHRGAALPSPERPIAEDDPAVILFTSGTSGRAKGATHSHRNVVCAVWFHLLNDAIAAEMGMPQADRRYLLATPLFHIAALHNLAAVRIAVGDTAVIHEGRFEIRAVLGLIEDERVTNWGAVPTMLSRLVELGDDLAHHDLSSLRMVTVNSAPSAHALRERLRELLPVAGRALGTSYGLTESSTGATIASAAMLAEDPETVGSPAPTLAVEVRDVHGRRVEDGVEGEVHLRGPQMMLGYWRNPEASVASRAENGWFRTGDIGSMHGPRLRIASRRSDLILRGGENVYPAEVENCIQAHPAVRECVVVGVADPDMGQAVTAVVVLHPGERASEGELVEFVHSRIARFKTPTAWTISETELPRNATGKVIRRDLPLPRTTGQVAGRG